MQKVIDGFQDYHDTITALFTVVLAISTIMLWWATRGLRVDALQTIEATKRSAKAALEANKLQTKQLIANYRPWLTVELDPIKFYRGDECFTLTYRCKLNNEGATAALKAGVYARLFLHEYGAPEIHETHSNVIRQGFSLGPRTTVRSQKMVELEDSVVLAIADIRAARSNRESQFTFTPVLIGAVFYYSPFSDEPFETRFVARLYKLEDYDSRTDTTPRNSINTDEQELTSLILERIPWTETFT
jgi:hypothetical protein